MSESMKATRAAVQIGSITVDAFMLPDGSYRMSLSQAANVLENLLEALSIFAIECFQTFTRRSSKHFRFFA